MSATPVRERSVVVLTGGTGGAKFLQGVAQVVPPERVTAIVNTGDDLTWWGLHVSPDLDSVMYGLAGMLSRERGWGLEGETFACLARMKEMGAAAWFQLGDRDLATHLRRSEMLHSGTTLSDATAKLCTSCGVPCHVLPMTDQRVETRVLTAGGELGFQEYFVRERWSVPATGVRFLGADQARPAPGVLECLAAASVVLIAPSNPVTSIGPILAVPGIRQALSSTPAAKVAVSPIIGNRAVSGPAAQLMQTQGWESSPMGVVQAYRDFLSALVVDESDRGAAAEIEASGIAVRCARALMDSEAAKAGLARAALAAAGTAARLATR